MKTMNKCAVSSYLSALMLILLAVAVSPSMAQPVGVKITDHNGKNIGTAQITQEKSGVRFQVHVSGLSPGEHGIHIHASGVCEPPTFKSAGPHFSPQESKHGFLDSDGPHEGDLPMLHVDSDGKVTDYDFTTTRVSLKRNSLKQPEGTSLIIHEKSDDYLTDTGGGTGNRIACGIIHPAGK